MSDLHDRLRRFWDEDAKTYDRSPSHAASDPVEAAAWRFRRDVVRWRARGMAADGLRRALGVADDHHAGYDADLLDSLPLARATSPEPLIRALTEAGWRSVRLERLRDVEWARRMAA